MIFCRPIHFTIALLVMLCYFNFSPNNLLAQSFVSQGHITYDTIENTKLIEFDCISDLSDTLIEEISTLFTRFIGVESVSFCDNSRKISISCISMLQPRDFKPLFAMLDIVVAGPLNLEEIQNKVAK
ncbi:MAG: hypothetical protein P8M05_12470 [Flavobacteriales bacterium]|nr:hypothetical protein [Flavobacteriales bacterium]